MRNALIAAILLSAGAAAAQDTGFVFGARGAWKFPMGDVESNISLSDVYSGALPVQGELGFHTGSIVLTAFGTYEFIDLKSQACAALVNCDGHGVRLGAQVEGHFGWHEPMDFWIGGGGGWEWLVAQGGATVKGQTLTGNVGWNGPFGFVQAGLDFGGGIRFGPWVAYGMGEYLNRQGSSSGAFAGSDINDKAWHEWIEVGARVMFR
jgi:hypothetical protein